MKQPIRARSRLGNVDDDDTHVPIAVEFQAMIDDLQRLKALVRQLFDERMVAQTDAEFKQLKFLAKKTKVMSKCAQVVIDAVDEQARTTSERAKVVSAKQEK